MQDPVYMLVIREPSDERLHVGNAPVSWAEQLNGVAVGLLANTYPNAFTLLTAPVVFAVQDETARTIRFTSLEFRHLRRLAERAQWAGLEVVLGPVLRPDPASESLAREISHLSWRWLERRAADPGTTDEAMQLIQARLKKNRLELAEFVRTWDADRIRNRLLNRHLAAAERRILEEALTGSKFTVTHSGEDGMFTAKVEKDT